MNYWLVKSEPFKYSWDDFVAQGVGMWDGVRNYQARNNMKSMKLGDLVFFYHSNEGLEVVGIAKVVKEHYPDPTTDDDRWVVVDLSPVEKLPKTVTLKQMKNDERLQDLALIKQSRLSVTPVKSEEFDIIVGLAHE
ncbi:MULTISPECIES: EVE domain-containing protein [Flectobacillus]|jgi:predicted RNA-binding protein with PUA-like domain|uniref:EVE domain-containing protein n=1 Tax=Flectobacillus roseus TaxID=502259 RepID=A0ABT6Y2K0_9BACT|nr:MULTISPECIES: EVE domain-containing protein [Flectobacillus]MDI9857785.1 EVE domain-containing protein [Flectobacillus roseus]MDI9869484.1 EVE domain-containing protein [Flectobacillus roseus]NBA76442.1 EVE domain-containing protein [Emticicia sp. ODNR4P]PAC27351.1 ubiquinol-cytochrome C reductase [Flectobacillus sp. BAB-3569]